MEKTNKTKRSKVDKKSKSKIRNKRNKMQQEKYASMSEYVSLAKKTINKFASQFYNGLNKEMLNNDDAISDVATAIMYADWRYDPNRAGASGMKKTLYSYRNQCAIWAIQTYITNKYKKSKINENLSLDFVLSDKENSISYHSTVNDKKQRDPLDIIIQNEDQNNIKYDLETLLDSGIITDKQKDQLKMYYMEDMTLSEIGKIYGVSREAIRQSIKRAIESIRSL
jgi:RNA polymerase sigma factor (sigma-70 family)